MLETLAPPYDVVLADPPWSYWGQQDKWGAAAKFYSTMATSEIADLPVRDLLADRAVVFVWTTSAKLPDALELLAAWKLFYRGIAFVWVKTTRAGVPISARGVRPSITKPVNLPALTDGASGACPQVTLLPCGRRSWPARVPQ